MSKEHRCYDKIHLWQTLKYEVRNIKFLIKLMYQGNIDHMSQNNQDTVILL